MKEAFINAKIFTSCKDRPYADSMLVEDGTICWIGEQADMPAFDGPVNDLHGRRVLPGFIDAHMHPIILADCAQKISCLPPNVHSISELIEKIRQRAQEAAPGEWIMGWGYDEEKFEEHRAPNRWDLDKASTAHPIEMMRSCSHVVSVNSKALEMAGITKDTPDPVGGEIERDTAGEPTGVLRENARHLLSGILPVKSREQRIREIVQLGEMLCKQGIVAVMDLGNLSTSDDYYDDYLEAANHGFRQELGIYYMWDMIRQNPDFRWTKDKAIRSQQIHRSGIKLLSDGSVGGRTAWMNEPYAGSTNEYGISVCTDEELDSAIQFCKEHECQLAVHAMGMRAIDRVMLRASQETPWMNIPPHIRVEHVTDPSEQAITLAQKRGIAFCTQLIFLYSEIESYRRNLGDEWIKRTYPLPRILDAEIKTALSTDAPATSWASPSNPFPNIKCAVTRRAYDGSDCGAKQRVSAATAIELYTREAAQICGFEGIGQLRSGYKASFIVLSDDILAIDPEKIDTIRVEKTYINGICVFG